MHSPVLEFTTFHLPLHLPLLPITTESKMISTWSLSELSTWFTPTILFCFLNLMIAIIFLTSRRKHSDNQPQIGFDTPHLSRTPSLLQRVKSFNFSFNRSDHYSFADSSVDSHVNDSVNVQVRHEINRSKSETVVETPAPVKIMKSSVSEKDLASANKEVEKRRPAMETATTRVSEKKGKSVSATGRSREDDAVDEKADDFINRFRQQLNLQRQNSILRYREMLNRGSGR